MTSTSSVHVRGFLRDVDGRAEVMAIGDVCKEDAKRFWEDYLPKMNPSIPVPNLSFEVYNVFGGHMYHLEQCFCRGVHPQQTSIVKMAMVRWNCLWCH